MNTVKSYNGLTNDEGKFVFISPVKQGTGFRSDIKVIEVYNTVTNVILERILHQNTKGLFFKVNKQHARSTIQYVNDYTKEVSLVFPQVLDGWGTIKFQPQEGAQKNFFHSAGRVR